MKDWSATFAELDAKNRAEGKCIMCGGSGVVANLHAIERTGDPHINRRCLRCKGTGKLQTRDAASPSDTQE